MQTILIVDNVTTQRELLVHWLQDDYSVFTAADGADSSHCFTLKQPVSLRNTATVALPRSLVLSPRFPTALANGTRFAKEICSPVQSVVTDQPA